MAKVTWDGPNDPENPKNWPSSRKWSVMLIVSLYTFISPVSSTMVAPALTYIGDDFNIKSEVLLELTLSIFILAYAIGPLFLGPLSETYGRTIVLQLANLFYLAFNIGCGVSQSKGQIIAFRFLSGLGGSVPLAVSWISQNPKFFLHINSSNPPRRLVEESSEIALPLKNAARQWLSSAWHPFLAQLSAQLLVASFLRIPLGDGCFMPPQSQPA
jgi:hypothetical protein